jgi:beta-phosphoglucomutase-like phosphatase (HAD superfamily)
MLPFEVPAMRKLSEVESARALMTEAMGWSVMKWLREKKRVRKAADAANAALDESRKQAQAGWSDEVKAAYRELGSGEPGGAANASLRQFVKRVLQADEEARRARQEAEDIFDQAERELSTAMAREGCRQALLQWELDEKAIAIAEHSHPVAPKTGATRVGIPR